MSTNTNIWTIDSQCAHLPAGGAASSFGCRDATGSLLLVHSGVWKTNRQLRLDTEAWCLTPWLEGNSDEGGQVTKSDPAAGSNTHTATDPVGSAGLLNERPQSLIGRHLSD